MYYVESCKRPINQNNKGNMWIVKSILGQGQGAQNTKVKLDFKNIYIYKNVFSIIPLIDFPPDDISDNQDFKRDPVILGHPLEYLE